MIKIYIASPYTNGDKISNVNLQLDVANELIERGYAPYTPLLMHFQHMRNPRQEHDWLKLDFEFLSCCDVLVRIKPLIDDVELTSKGADEEEAEARRLEIPVFVFHTIEDLCLYLDEHPFEI